MQDLWWCQNRFDNAVRILMSLFILYCFINGKVISNDGPGSSVGMATGYGLDGPGIESRWGRDFPHLSRPAHPASYTMGTGSFPGVKSGRDVTMTPHPLLVPMVMKE
jgi:hypothetical protein